MSTEMIMVLGVVGLTLVVLLFMGPAMWSSDPGWPVFRWLKREFKKLMQEPPQKPKP